LEFEALNTPVFGRQLKEGKHLKSVLSAGTEIFTSNSQSLDLSQHIRR